MATGGNYEEGQTIRLTATFTVGDVNTDPGTVTLKTSDPSGDVATYTYALGEITKSATGVYYKDITCSEVGKWWYRFTGTGAAAGVKEAWFRIDESRVV